MQYLKFQLYCWGKELSNYSLLRHRNFEGHLVTGKNSGTHWVKYIICLALAEHYGVEPPAYFNAEATNAFMGNPKNVQPLPGLPRLASSHTIPGFAYDSKLTRPADEYPPVAVLVRDLRHVLISHYEKWKDKYALSWSDFLRIPPDQRGIRCDIWWYMHFLNRWGDCMKRLPGEIIVLRFEDMQAGPTEHVTRILKHFDLHIPHHAIDCAVAASSKEAMDKKTDPDFPERIIRKEETGVEDYFSGEDGDFFARTIARNLRHRFGYDYGA